MKKKVLALVLAMVLVVVGVAAGTLAWLTAKSDTVTNTFTTSDIKVKLEETKNNSERPQGNSPCRKRGVLSVCEAGEIREL